MTKPPIPKPPTTPRQLAAWLERMSWTQAEGAQQLGIALRRFAYLLAGERDGASLEIPRTIALAAHALEVDHATHARGGGGGGATSTR